MEKILDEGDIDKKEQYIGEKDQYINKEITEKQKILLIYKLGATNEKITTEEKDVLLPIYPNDIAAERH